MVLRFLRTWAWLFVQAGALTALVLVLVVASLVALILAWNLVNGTISVWWHQLLAVLVILLVVTGVAAAVRPTQ